WADDFGNERWAYGVERGWLEETARYWADEYDWRAEEAAINRLPQYRLEIDGVPVHFVHVKGKGPAPMPLVLTHGWPWTFWDWKDVIGPLADPAAHGGDPADAFDVIVPSLPGFGFSTPLRTTGIGARRVAELWVTLMGALGYDRFAAAGGDWGAIVTAELGHAHADHLTGVYLTLPQIPGINLRDVKEEDFAPDEAWMWQRSVEARPTIMSHSSVHIHDPQTLAYALCDSPVGTAAWLWERRRNWSDCDGDVAGLFGRDFLCTTASIYWLTKTIGTSLRLYNEHFSRGWPVAHDRKPEIPVPTGFGISPKELLMLPRAWAEERTDLRRWTIFPRGGHFAPSEQPQQVIDEFRAFFRELR
ncbi:MAG: epoxide hydrolase, partial [Actinobacteria bacterium]|nr:epoxide hydrolase [Actinomycetota bacterium]